ncbi:MAG: DUF3043 domain-containing protein [Nocardioidaceae bacterium]|nr:MAG: DUF3043 domain-containing protein [Nocardioidaceae bacterium]
MFRRTKATTETPETSETALGDEPAAGKGRPTPTRKEAEAAAKARAQASRDPKARKSNARSRQVSAREIREGIKRGDERYLGKRDRGPVRRFVRDFVDSRVNIAEFTLPLMFASLLLSAADSRTGSMVLNITILVVALDMVWLNFRLRRELRRRFPSQSTKGATFYALTRALYLRFMRLPKPQVKLGQALPDRYV